MRTIRICKALLVLSVALFGFFVATGNIFDPDFNYRATENVVTMASATQDHHFSWRALPAGFAVDLAFTMIVIAETLVGLFCLVGGSMMLSSKDAAYYRGVTISTVGLVLGVLIWYTGFIVIGGEWFRSWESGVSLFNGIGSAYRFSSSILLILIFLHMPEPVRQ